MLGTMQRAILPVNCPDIPDTEFWDSARQRYMAPTAAAMACNEYLDGLAKKCEEMLAARHFDKPQQLVEALRNDEKPVITFGSFLRDLIHTLRTGTHNKRPSRNYQVYITLLHKLEKEGRIIDVPLSEISNKHFVAFGDFILSLSDKDGRSNYLNLMKLFKQVHKKAFNKELNDNVLRFKYSDEAPMYDDTGKRPSLTKQQYSDFVSLDVNSVLQSGPRKRFYASLYHDFCVFMYEAKMRPVDVLKLKFSEVVEIEGKLYIKYIPEKKKNYRSLAKITISPLTPTAKSLLEKYRGQSAQGYVFPFSMNNYEWDMMDAKSWNQWNCRKQAAIEKINKWLKKAGEKIGLNFGLTLYTFRHSALSHACADNPNYMQIALEAGTTPSVLMSHYVSNVV